MKIIPNNLKRMYDLYAPEYEQKRWRFSAAAGIFWAGK